MLLLITYLAPTDVNPQPLTDAEGEPTGKFAIVDTKETFKALAFKIMDDRFGALTFIRIYSGKLKKGDTILNSFTGKTERVGRMVEMQADDRTELSEAQAGDILAIVGMKNVQTGHTLCDPKDPPMYVRSHGFPCTCNFYFCNPLKIKAALKKWVLLSVKWLQKIQRSKLKLTKIQAKQFYVVWVNFT